MHKYLYENFFMIHQINHGLFIITLFVSIPKNHVLI